MALVSYGSSDESDLSEEEEEQVKKETSKVKSVAEPEVKKDVANIEEVNKDVKNVNSKDKDSIVEGHISDEEDEFIGSSVDHGDDLLAGDNEPDLFSLIAKKLPNAKKAKKVAVVEELGPIPEKKVDYGEKIEEPPAKKPKRVGPVKITIPSLAQFDEEEPEKPTVRVEPSKSGSGLFALLPQPKNRINRPQPTNRSILPNPPSSTNGVGLVQNNLKPEGVRTVGMVPHRVANPSSKPTKPNLSSKPIKSSLGSKPGSKSDSDDDDDLLGVGSTGSNSYFPAPTAPLQSKYKLVNPVPLGPTTPQHTLPPSLPADPSFVSLNMRDDISATGTPYEEVALGPAVAPYPPPPPTYPDPSNSLIDDQEAINRLAGKANKMKEFKEDLNIIDINEDDMKGDPREWLTKAMTEEKAPRPSGKGPKGLAKTRHQITYLAHQAKERDWELKQEWATARENRNASRNKYGFL